VIEPDRGQARQWAQQELARPEYARDRPGWFQRLVEWLGNQLERVAHGTGLGAGQLLALVLFAVVAAVAIGVLLRRNVRLRVAAAHAAPAVFGLAELSGEEHRRRAARAMAEGSYDEAVREWLRALARRLDERGLLDPRPGRTADELAAEAARLLPALRGELAWAAAMFDAVSYGSRPAQPQDAERMRGLDGAVESAQPSPGLVGVP
jgi:hypothetical protein